MKSHTSAGTRQQIAQSHVAKRTHLAEQKHQATFRRCRPPRMHTVLQPSLLRIGAGASRTLPSVLHGLNLHRPLLVTDDFIKRSGVLGKIESDLSDAGLHHSTFAECTPDPTTSVVSAGLAAWHASPHRPDCVVGIGGGSPIDTAKAIAVLATAPADAALRSYKVPSAPPSGVPIVAVPTTAGTGSEATRATVISDVETGEKMLIMGSSLMPIAALVDFELTLTKPSRLTADTAVDALCHAMEAYVSRRRNPYSDAHALAAMRTIPRYVRLACEKPDDREAREALMLAATQAGIAFSNSSVTLIHGMSRPLGAHFHVPHGMSNAMLLPAVTAFSISGAPERYADCARAMGLVAPSTDDDVAACAALVAGLERLCVDLKVPTPQSFGIDRDDYVRLIGLMGEQAIASGSPANNPLVPNAREVEALYQQAWSR